ncbi:ABC-F family ATP-binding cassette domain-containing protein [Oryzihumus leptocrescens]|uniref:ATPase subunit of ABC transporter with duplicated ATPase domains n=1 Tax=Oryzihumus leptocrescens TaxID=297536 RepID=A0A542ZJY8_9MICO|nr:ABC-F family ATP-binding cassette domain-containing protein [Oryzihumus leptocrescens]TQL60598.1 ATPase subunit of ABC transporter with duplicated ATPase domains [Oryzihumus leptocrescens]
MLRAVSLSKHYDLEPLFEDLDLTLGPGDRVGLVGPNGTGKSTLMRLLAGVEEPTSGAVVRSPGLTVGWQAQEAPDPGMPVAQFVLSGAPQWAAARERMHALEAGLASGAASRPADGDRTADRAMAEYASAVEEFESLGGWATLARLDQVRSRLGVATEAGIAGDRPMGSLSGGEQSRVMLARLLVTDPDVLLLDEPTNHLDAEGRAWLGEHLASFRGAVLVISHDRRFLDRVVNRVVELDGIAPGLQDYPGCGYTAYRVEKQRRWERLLLDFEAQEKYRRALAEDIERTKEYARGVEVANPRNPSARRLARKVARKALSRERRLARQMQAASWIAQPQTRPTLAMRFEVGDGEAPETLADVRGLDVAAGERVVVRDASLRVRREDRILLSGANGAGKTSLLRALTPLLRDAAVLPQTHEHLPTGISALELFRREVPMYLEEAEAVLEGFLFDAHDRERAVGDLSVGQVRRLLIATLVNTPSRVLVLDEPTNHLDFDSLEVVEAALAQYRGALLVVSHDEEFAQRVGLQRRWQVVDGRLEAAA